MVIKQKTKTTRRKPVEKQPQPATTKKPAEKQPQPATRRKRTSTRRTVDESGEATPSTPDSSGNDNCQKLIEALTGLNDTSKQDELIKTLQGTINTLTFLKDEVIDLSRRTDKTEAAIEVLNTEFKKMTERVNALETLLKTDIANLSNHIDQFNILSSNFDKLTNRVKKLEQRRR